MPTYRAGAVANDGQTANTGTASVTIPATAVAGDVALFTMAQNSGTAIFTAPAGWTLVRGPDTINTNLRTALWKKQLVSGEPGTTISFTSDVGARLPGAMIVFSGTTADRVSAAEMSTMTTAGTTVTSPSITTSVNDSRIVGFWALRDATAAPSADLTVPSTHTARAVSKTAYTTSPNYTIQTSHRTADVAAGTYGSSSATASEAVTAIVYYVALAPTATTVPVAAFTATPTSGNAPLAVTFTDTSTNTPTSWSWNFGDGATSTAQNPTHTYASAGTYTVTMSATNAGGTDAADPKTITVSGAAASGAGLKAFQLVGGAYVAASTFASTPA